MVCQHLDDVCAAAAAGSQALHRLDAAFQEIAVRQVVFTDVLIVGRLGVDGQSFAPIGLNKVGAASDWLVWKACWEASCKINRIWSARGVILAFTGKKKFHFN
jgi:hypothetical protein